MYFICMSSAFRLRLIIYIYIYDFDSYLSIYMNPSTTYNVMGPTLGTKLYFKPAFVVAPARKQALSKIGATGFH